MTPCDLSLSHGHVRVVDVGSGPALVLLHGLGGNWRNWAANISVLSQSHRVVALDLPGFGCSEPYTGAVTIERYVDTVVELLDRLGIERTTFVGNSLGGLLTIETAARHPDRVGAAILVGSGGIPMTSLRHRLIAIPQARAVNYLLRRPRARRAVARGDRARRLIAGMVFHDPRTIPEDLVADALNGLGAPAFRAVFDAGQSYDARVRAPHVACPTLVLWGREDRLLPVAMGEELHRLIPDSRLVVWNATGHCPMIENPARFHDLVTAFSAETAEKLPPGARS